MRQILINFFDNLLSKKHRNFLKKQWINNCRTNGIDPFKRIEGEEEYLSLWKRLDNDVEPYSYRLFSHYMEKGDIVPESLGMDLERYLNPRRYIPFYSDKNLYSTYLGENVAPKTIIARINGSSLLNCDFTPIQKFLYKEDHMRNIPSITSAEITDFLYPYEEVCLKPSVDSCSGQGVELFQLSNGLFLNKKGEELNGTTLLKKGPDFVIQEVLSQHPYISQFNSTSINTIRLSAYRSVITDEIIINGALMRIGATGSFVDNAHAGGRFVGINIDTGELHKTTHDQWGTQKNIWNGIDFTSQSFVIPHWSDIIEFAKTVANRNHHMRLQAMDICLDSNGSPRLVEINVGGFSYWLFMFCGQDVFKGELHSVIDYCIKMRGQKKAKLRILDI